MAHDVFISHSSKDKIAANQVCSKLEESGIQCWIAPRNIRSGEMFPEAIANAIKNCKILILVYSENANSSRDVANELILAVHSNLTIIPLSIDNTEPSGVMQYYLSGAHWIDMDPQPGSEQLAGLVKTIKGFLINKNGNSLSDKSGEDIKINDAGEIEAEKGKEVGEEQSPGKQEKKAAVSPAIEKRNKLIMLAAALAILIAGGAMLNHYYPRWYESLIGPGSTISEPFPINDHDTGNSGGNIINLGLVVQQGNMIYYSNLDDDGRIYAFNQEAGEHIQVNDDSSSYLNLIDDWIYYRNESAGDKIFKVKIDGSGRTQINDAASEAITVVGDYIFYINVDQHNRIYRIKTDGTDNIRLNNEGAWSLFYQDNWIYYLNRDQDDRIYRIRPDGSERNSLGHERAGWINVIDDWVYYANHNDDMNIYRIKTDGSNRERINNEHSEYINVMENNIYYLSHENGGILKRINQDSSDVYEIKNSFCVYINILDDSIIYMDRTSGDRLYMTGFDGAEHQVLTHQ